MLLSLSWLIGLTAPLFTILGEEISGRDLILIAGGLFLLGKSTYEIHDRLEGADGHGTGAVKASFAAVVGQIVLLNVVFSLDSVITAVGMVDELFIMIAAVMIAIWIMLVSAGAISSQRALAPATRLRQERAAGRHPAQCRGVSGSVIMSRRRWACRFPG